MQRSTLALAAVVLVAAALIVLDRPAAPPAVAPAGAAAGALPEGHPPLNPTAQANAVPAEGPFATVLETLDSGGYTYARVETGSEEGEVAEIWVAGPPTPLTEGDEVSLAGAMGMENFRAASLDRTFDAILFVNRFAGRSESAPAPGAAPQGEGAVAASPSAGSGVVVEVAHAAGYSYVLVDQAGTERWIAGDQIDVAEGQTVTWDGGAVMRSFESPSLDRTFDEIVFANGLRVRE